MKKYDGIKKQQVPFSQIPNSLINDKNLSLKSKGLYSFMFSKPNGWNFTIRSMSKQLKEGVDSISNGLNELKSLGWVEYYKKKDGSGVYVLNHLEDIGFKPNTENPNQGNPNLGKPVCISNKDLYSNKDDYKYSNKRKQKIVRQDLLERYLAMFNGLKEKFVNQRSSVTIKNKKVVEDWNKFIEEVHEDDLINTHIPDIKKAIEAACKSEWHKNSKYRSITPSFFLRADKREWWLDVYNSEHSTPIKKQYDVSKMMHYSVNEEKNKK